MSGCSLDYMRAASYFRIQTADRNVGDLLDPAQQISRHWSEDEVRDQPGVSVCASLEDLARYLATSGIPFGSGEWVIVELLGERTEARGCDAADGELLVLPYEIVSVVPMGDEFYEMVGAAFDEMES